MRAERVLLLPTAAELTGTPYTEARTGAEAAVAEAGGQVLGGDDAPHGDGTATALAVLKPISPDALEAALEANPDLSWVQLPFAGVEPYIPLFQARPHITWTSAKGIYAPPVAEHALALTLALLRHLPERVRATSWGEEKEIWSGP